MFDPKVFKGQPGVRLSREQFVARYREQFVDPRFHEVAGALEQVIEVAWQNYEDSHKAPRKIKAGPEYQDPEYELSSDWVETRDRLLKAEAAQKVSPDHRILVINGSARNEHTCPSEAPKSYRLAQAAIDTITREGAIADFLDLSELTAAYGKKIHPCKACVSTAMPLCHWPCSCYPNHGLGQTQDWMAEIYERWVLAHGVLIITPVHWYQAPSVLKLMIDRLVCADGGNPDPTSTHGKDAKAAKKMELKGWNYPKHLAGRSFGLVVHGDAAGVENLRRILTDWLTDMELLPAGREAIVGRYIGYYQPYATSHSDLDKDTALFQEVDHAAASVVRQVKLTRSGQFSFPDRGLKEPRPK